MDVTTLVGLFIGVTVVLLAVMTGSNLFIFFNIPGLLIVLGGTFAATLIKFPMKIVFSAFAIGVKAAFVNEKEDIRSLIESCVELAKLSRANGILALEDVEINEPFLKKAFATALMGWMVSLFANRLPVI